MEFFIVDVFARDRFSGNQLAVVVTDGSLDGTEMLSIAREFNFSETVFIPAGRPPSDTWDIRIFTPAREIPFAGHPVLGAAHVIINELHMPDEGLTLNCAAGSVPVHAGEDVLWMQQREPDFGRVYEGRFIYGTIGVDLNDLDQRFPIQKVSTGLNFLLVPLRSLDAVRNCRIDKNMYDRTFSTENRDPIFVFCPVTEDPANRIHCRMFAHVLGIDEDPATGSAAGCLAGYLVRYEYFGTDSVNITAEQGFEMGRPSILHLRACVEDNRIGIRVGGRAITVARGRLL